MFVAGFALIFYKGQAFRNKDAGLINPIRVGGAESARTFFRWLFLHVNIGLEVQNFVIFPNLL